MAEYAFGANIIENLTTGMYQDSKVIYREYIQNACDQIDKAEQLGILQPRNPNSKYPDLGQGVVNIWIKPEERYIVIEDNATGIKAEEFQRTLGNIAIPTKSWGKIKVFEESEGSAVWLTVNALYSLRDGLVKISFPS
ncbi:hypothetical protein [Gordoniibacillus kamchatkensis]|uniref:hypothetical protein n=1 Tax=Gordoniibacillus kamchatkensis TaxID=1590651 RepID=UPI000696E290|nr:hypothetical protein [Paenibacillus sp. VKM B-2647]